MCSVSTDKGYKLEWKVKTVPGGERRAPVRMTHLLLLHFRKRYVF
jgi:hypothetical protein